MQRWERADSLDTAGTGKQTWRGGRRGRKLRGHRGMWLFKVDKSNLLEDSYSPSKNKTDWLGQCFILLGSSRRRQSTSLIPVASFPHFTSKLGLKFPPLHLTCSNRASSDKISLLHLTVLKEKQLHTENYINRNLKHTYWRGKLRTLSLVNAGMAQGWNWRWTVLNGAALLPLLSILHRVLCCPWGLLVHFYTMLLHWTTVRVETADQNRLGFCSKMWNNFIYNAVQWVNEGECNTARVW